MRGLMVLKVRLLRTTMRNQEATTIRRALIMGGKDKDKATAMLDHRHRHHRHHLLLQRKMSLQNLLLLLRTQWRMSMLLS